MFHPRIFHGVSISCLAHSRFMRKYFLGLRNNQSFDNTSVCVAKEC